MTKHTILDHGYNIHRDMWHVDHQHPSDLEIKIRKEVMDAVDELVTETNQEYSTTKAQSLAEVIQDRLSLLWGE